MMYTYLLGMLTPGNIDNLNILRSEVSPGTVLIYLILMEAPIVMIMVSQFVKTK